jgi:hypothetical protein
VTRPPTPEQLQTLEDLRSKLRSLQDEVHEIHLPGGDASAFRQSLQFGGPRTTLAILDGFDALARQMAGLESMVEAHADGALPLDDSTVWRRAEDRRYRSLRPERDVPDGEGDASHTIPALATS